MWWKRSWATIFSGRDRRSQKYQYMDEFGEFLFKIPHKMTNEWIDYAENVHVRTPFKYPSNNNSLITNNNSFLTSNMHHQPPQQFYNKMGIKPFNNNLNNNNSSALNQYSLMNKFQKPSRGESQVAVASRSKRGTFIQKFRPKRSQSHFINREKSSETQLFPLSFPIVCVWVCRKQFLTPSHETKILARTNKVETFSKKKMRREK